MAELRFLVEGYGVNNVSNVLWDYVGFGFSKILDFILLLIGNCYPTGRVTKQQDGKYI